MHRRVDDRDFPVIERLLSRPDLRDLEFGGILSTGQIDVRHLLLADLLLAPSPGARTCP